MTFFQCPSCVKTSMPYASLVEYCKRRHKFKFHFNTKNIVEARYHECHICAKIILCDNRVLGSHLKSHKMKLSQYNSDYVLKNGNIVIPTFKDFQSNPKVFDSIQPNNIINKNHPKNNDLISPDMISSESEDSDV